MDGVKPNNICLVGFLKDTFKHPDNHLANPMLISIFMTLFTGFTT